MEKLLGKHSSRPYNRDDLAVVVAGYTGPMERFLDSNPGLRSRFPKTIFFADYTPDETTRIFLSLAEASGFVPTPPASARSTRRTEPARHASARRGGVCHVKLPPADATGVA